MTKPTVCAVFAGLLMFALAPQVRAHDDCSVGDLKGDYSFILSGSNISDSSLPVGPFAAAGKTTYNGDGTAYGVIQASLTGGQLASGWTATYKVSSLAPCTFTKTITLDVGGTLNYFITVGDDFRELRFVDTDKGTSITGTARKQ